MKYDFIGLRSQTINGVKNPMLTLVGTVTEKKYKFIVLADGKEINYTLDVINNDGDFALFAPFDNSVRVIEVFIEINKKKYFISRLENITIIKAYKKVMQCIYKVCHIIKAAFITLFRGIKFLWKEYHFLVPPKMWGNYWKSFLQRIKERGVKLYNNPFDINDYNSWISNVEKHEDYIKQKYEPLISIVIPVYNIEKKYLSECLDSILNQSYKNFEVCIADDNSTKKETIDTLKEYENKDKRIRVIYRKENGHISACSNSALKIAKGEYIALVDDDDLLAPDALSEVVKALNINKKFDLIYSDEDKINTNGKRLEPHFKPDFSPDTLLSLNYICHLTVIRRSLIDKVGGFEEGLEGAQDYDLLLKVTEKTNNIYHISKILYHWRMTDKSTASKKDSKNYAFINGKKAIENALNRRKINAKVIINKKSSFYSVLYQYKSEPKVSIIIPTKDHADILKKCIDSVLKKTSYNNYEIVIVDNGSTQKEALDFLNKCKNNMKISVIRLDCEFNFSYLNNEAVKKCNGEYIVLLNNDTEIITPNWLEIMVGYAMQDHIGTVGVKLLYPDNTIQHAGVVIGLGGVASHSFIGFDRYNKGFYGLLEVPTNYAANTAACLMVKKSKYLSVNGLNEELKVAYNDIDFNLKLLEKGYYNVFFFFLELYHYESKSRGLDTTKEKYERFLKESSIMNEKWKKYIERDPFYNSNFSLKSSYRLDNVISKGGIKDEK